GREGTEVHPAPAAAVTSAATEERPQAAAGQRLRPRVLWGENGGLGRVDLWLKPGEEEAGSRSDQREHHDAQARAPDQAPVVEDVEAIVQIFRPRSSQRSRREIQHD